MYILFYKGKPIEVHNTQVSIAKKLGITRQSVFGAIKGKKNTCEFYHIEEITAENAHLVAELMKKK